MRFLVAIAFLFAFCDLACTQPVISRGQQILAISYDDCLRRGQSAFSTEGGANIGTSGNAVAAFKGIHGSYIVCNPAPDMKMAVNIFVASNSNDGGVPGLERQRLQARMESSGSPPPTLQRSCWRWDVEMQDGRRVDAILEMKANGDLFIAK